MLHLIFSIAAMSCVLTTAAGNLQASPNPYDAPLPDFSTPVTHEEVRMAYYRYSVVSIVKKLHENNAANWNMIMGKGVKGDKEWIQYAAIYIAPGTDAGATTDYMVSLAHALSNNPRAVLSLEGSADRSLLAVCTLPFIEPEYDFIQAYGKKTQTALKEVKEEIT
ncbi:hypothetical protein NB640_00290 [Oxalobacter vibrioformis]|uniref:Uncharacterized protein n=1 Tax=Oxalobacter vibrioformis TaxID=933080 RepID=A0A9E9LZ22_9BURK|nr:hypothetical protein [Oxalobacter vibrioformis]WAW10149.1 hypothetical protein NB640_00290 [Oxalobacter vibrioformis]